MKMSDRGTFIFEYYWFSEHSHLVELVSKEASLKVRNETKSPVINPGKNSKERIDV